MRVCRNAHREKSPQICCRGSETAGHGGIRYIARVIGCSEKTIERGLAELDNLANDLAAERIRQPGASRKKVQSESAEEENLIAYFGADYRKCSRQGSCVLHSHDAMRTLVSTC